MSISSLYNPIRPLRGRSGPSVGCLVSLASPGLTLHCVLAARRWHASRINTSCVVHRTPCVPRRLSCLLLAWAHLRALRGTPVDAGLRATSRARTAATVAPSVYIAALPPAESQRASRVAAQRGFQILLGSRTLRRCTRRARWCTPCLRELVGGSLRNPNIYIYIHMYIYVYIYIYMHIYIYI